MELIKPDFGLIFWMTLAFLILFLILAKFAFPMIGKMLKEREKKINEALEEAERTHEEMKNLKADNDKILQEAREEREKIISEGRKIHDDYVEKAKAKAEEEAKRIVDNAKIDIENEKKAAITDIKNEIAKVSLLVAEKILERELNSDEAQMEYVDKIVKELDKDE